MCEIIYFHGPSDIHLELNGHTGKAENGRPSEVCAAVSVLVYAAKNAMNYWFEDSEITEKHVEIAPGHCLLKAKMIPDTEGAGLEYQMDVIANTLRQLADKYPESIHYTAYEEDNLAPMMSAAIHGTASATTQ